VEPAWDGGGEGQALDLLLLLLLLLLLGGGQRLAAGRLPLLQALLLAPGQALQQLALALLLLGA
jgi:hypothetical protein